MEYASRSRSRRHSKSQKSQARSSRRSGRSASEKKSKSTRSRSNRKSGKSRSRADRSRSGRSGNSGSRRLSLSSGQSGSKRPKYLYWKQQKDGRFQLCKPGEDDINKILGRAVMCKPSRHRPRLSSYRKPERRASPSRRAPTKYSAPPTPATEPRPVTPYSDDRESGLQSGRRSEMTGRYEPLPGEDEPAGLNEEELLAKEAELNRKEEEHQKFEDDRERMLDELEAEQQDITCERERVTAMSMELVSAREQMMEHLAQEKAAIREMRQGGDGRQSRQSQDPGRDSMNRSDMIEEEVDDPSQGIDMAPGAARENRMLDDEEAPKDVDMDQVDRPPPAFDSEWRTAEAPDSQDQGLERRPEHDPDEPREELMDRGIIPEKEPEMDAYDAGRGVVHEIRERREELEDLNQKITYEEDDLRKQRDEYQSLADELLKEERKLRLLRDAVEDKLRALEPMEDKLRAENADSGRNALRGGDGSPTRYVS